MLRKNTKKRKWKIALLLLCCIALLTVGAQPAFAAGEKLYFGSEEYEWTLNEDHFLLGVYASSDGTIASVEMEVTYDPEMLSLVQGGELVEDGRIQVASENVRASTFKRLLSFRPLMAGETEVSIHATVTGTDGAVHILDAVSVPVTIQIPQSCYLDGISVNGTALEGFESSKAEYEVTPEEFLEDAQVSVTPESTSAEITVVSEGEDAEQSGTQLAAGENVVSVVVTGSNGAKARYRITIQNPEAPVVEETATPAETEETREDAEVVSGETANDEVVTEEESTAQASRLDNFKSTAKECINHVKSMFQTQPRMAWMMVFAMAVLLAILMWMFFSLHQQKKLEEERRRKREAKRRQWEAQEAFERAQQALEQQRKKRREGLYAVGSAQEADVLDKDNADDVLEDASADNVPEEVMANDMPTDASADKTDISTSTEEIGIASSAQNMDAVIPGEKIDVVSSTEKSEAVSSTEKSEAVSFTEMVEASASTEETEVSASTEETEASASTEKTEAASSTKKTGAATSKKKTGTATSTKKTGTSSTKKKKKKKSLSTTEPPKEDNRKIEIRVSHVTMDFKREKDESTSIKETVIRTLKRQRSFEYFRALDDVSFDVREGDVVGIIGTNGSGKSTILKIISGVLSPTEGYVDVDKHKIQLLTLGTGFDMELTGRENVYLNGAIIGYTKEYIDEKYDDIVKFAELEGFMEEKVRNYSSGMVSRLGFAIATARDTPEILILDEVLSVGDMFFRKKSEARIQEMIHGGSTVLIVSHSTGVIRKNCNKVVWIEKGKLRAIGTPKKVCSAYEKMNEE